MKLTLGPSKAAISLSVNFFLFIFPGSIDKLPPQATIIDTQQKPNVIFIARKIENAKTCDKTIQTDARSYTLALKQGVSYLPWLYTNLCLLLITFENRSHIPYSQF